MDHPTPDSLLNQMFELTSTFHIFPVAQRVPLTQSLSNQRFQVKLIFHIFPVAKNFHLNHDTL